VIVVYASNKLEKLCTSDREMRRQRADIAGKLKLRLKALEAASSVEELPEQDPLGRWHPYKGDRVGEWSGDVSRNWRLIVREVPGEAAAVCVEVVELWDPHKRP